MRKNIILIPPCNSYGDVLSVISLYYFLLEYYEKVYLYIIGEELFTYYNAYFENEPLFKQRIFLTDKPEDLINNGEFGDYDICNTLTEGWNAAQFDFYDLSNIDKDYYFNDLNPLYNKLKIDDKYLCKPNKHLPNEILSINHKFYYELVGLNNKVRMDFFNYRRNYEKELELKNNILRQKNITGEYIVINNPLNHPVSGFNLPTINISYLATCVGQLTLLVEGAEEIHFIESNNVNFFYHSQYKGIFNYNKQIHFHVRLRNRHWIMPNMMIDWSWKMMDDPRLNNWNFIF